MSKLKIIQKKKIDQREIYMKIKSLEMKLDTMNKTFTTGLNDVKFLLEDTRLSDDDIDALVETAIAKKNKKLISHKEVIKELGL